MNKKNKIIIFGLFLSFAFLCSISIFLGSQNVFQNRSHSLPHSDVQKNNQPPISTDEQLTSYFFISLIAFGFLFLINLFKPFEDELCQLTTWLIPQRSNLSKAQQYYLAFTATVLEIIIYEKNVYLINNKAPVLNFDFHQFLTQFILQSQVGKHEVRQETRTKIMKYFKEERQRHLIKVFIQFTITHLFAFLLNFILNFFQHGVQTWKRLKWNSILKIIPNMKHKYERIIAYFLFFFPLGECCSRYFFGYHFCNYQKCIEGRNNLSYYWLLRYFLNFNNDQIGYGLFPYQIILKKNQENIAHRNLDAKIYPLEKDFDNPQEIIKQGAQFQTQTFQSFVNAMKQVFDLNDQFEQEVFDKVQKFVNNKE